MVGINATPPGEIHQGPYFKVWVAKLYLSTLAVFKYRILLFQHQNHPNMS